MSAPAPAVKSLELGDLPRGRITFSMYSMYLRCPFQFMLRYIEGKIEPPKGALILGRGTHKGLEWGFKDHIEKGKPPKSGDVVDAAVAGIEEELKDVPASEVQWGKDDNPAKVKDDSVRMLTAYDPFRVKIKPAAVEKSFEIGFSNTDYKLIGREDLVTKDKAVVDHKTAGKSAPEDAAEKSEQLGVYNLDEPEAKSLELHVLVRTKEAKVQILKSPPRSPAERRSLLENIGKVATLMKAGIFPKIIEGAPGSPCSWCGMYEACRGRKPKWKE